MTQPLPPQEPYPHAHWLITSLSHQIFDLEKIITCVTDRDEILTLYWHCYGPIPEPRVKIRRGQATTRDPHLSWHPWGWIRQNEPGDVYTHTFTIPRNGIPTRIWFNFQGATFVFRKCGNCNSTDFEASWTWDFYCLDCYHIWPMWPPKDCPLCGSNRKVSGHIEGYHCNNCGHRAHVDDLKWDWKSRSCSPFFFQEWTWLPLQEVKFHEPWSSYTPDMVVLFYENWSLYYPQMEVRFHEPWSS